jgi:hypothetical protein
MSLFWTVILVVTISLVALLFWLSKSSSSKADKDNKDGDSTSTLSEEEKSLQAIVELNLTLRKSAIDTGLIEQAEVVIDQLVELIPAINAVNMPGSDLVWTVNRIATEYLPNKCILPYLALSTEAQADPVKIETMQANLSALNKELTDVEQMLARRDESEFKAKADFLKHKFNNHSGE